MRPRSRLSFRAPWFVSALALSTFALGAPACGDDAADTTPQPPVEGGKLAAAYGGIWAGPDENGTLDLSLGGGTSPTVRPLADGPRTVTGSLVLPSLVGPIALTGSITAAGELTFAGTASSALGAFTCTTGFQTNICVPSCGAALDCGADVNSTPVGTDTWSYFTCTAGVCG